MLIFFPNVGWKILLVLRNFFLFHTYLTVWILASRYIPKHRNVAPHLAIYLTTFLNRSLAHLAGVTKHVDDDAVGFTVILFINSLFGQPRLNLAVKRGIAHAFIFLEHRSYERANLSFKSGICPCLRI